MMTERRMIDISASEMLDMMRSVIRDIVAEEIEKALSVKTDEYASSLNELCRRLNVSKNTARSAAKRIPNAVERISSRRCRYNLTKIVEGNVKIFS